VVEKTYGKGEFLVWSGNTAERVMDSGIAEKNDLG